MKAPAKACNTCRYFDKPWCKRYPPVATQQGTYWPSNYTDDWCGEWKKILNPPEKSD